MKLKDLKANPKNPRKISSNRLNALEKSVKKYGDLSGFVYNTRSKQMVSGHQKQKISGDAKIQILEKFDPPTEQRTTAIGWVHIGSERFKYREVDADKSWETGAMLAANKHQGEWDDDLLRVALTEIQPIDYEVAGFTVPEIKALNIEIAPVPYGSDPEPPRSNEEDDAEYLANEEKTTEQIPTENPNGNSKSAFEETEENTEPQGRRIIIIISCPTDEVKAELKEKLREEVEKAGAAFF